jgi:peptidoglycan/xylan/chitin deacetylase (PgdA/CDA1 family)
LAYHGIDDPERFELHLDHIMRTACAVTLAEALDAFDGRRALPRRAVLITFDDGHRSVLESGMPLLLERGLPAAAFVIAGHVGTDAPFWWSEVIDLARAGGHVRGLEACSPEDLVRTLKRVSDERRRSGIDELRETASRPAARMTQLTAADLRTLESAGIAIGNHTWSHPCLPRCRDDASGQEVEEAHDVLTDLLGRPPEAFAYPNGDRDPRRAAQLRQLGYRAAFLFDHQLSPHRPIDPLAVSRLRVNSTTSPARFETISSGLHPALHRARGGA